MQVDLFDKVLVGRTKRQMKQIATRKFKIAAQHRKLDGINSYFSSSEACEVCRKQIQKALSVGRKYSNIGNSMSDSLFEVEALGIADSNQPYVTIADFSNCLDYVLHRLYGCKISDIRSIEDYDIISRTLIDCELANPVDIPVSRLVLASRELASHFAALSYQSKNETGCNDRPTWIAYQFYLDVMNMVSLLKFYTTVVVCDSFTARCGRKGIIRSTSHAKVVAASSVKFDEIVTMHDVTGSGFDDYDIVYRTYLPYEYLGESLLRKEFRRNLAKGNGRVQ